MIDIKVTWSGAIEEKLKNANYKVAKEVEGALKDAAFLVEGTAKKKIQQGSRSGRLYRRGAVNHRASAPGEPPKTDTGRLVNSIRHNVKGFLSVEVGSDVNYAIFLEQGTPGSKMSARPYLQPSLDENQDKINQLVLSALERAFK